MIGTSTREQLLHQKWKFQKINRDIPEIRLNFLKTILEGMKFPPKILSLEKTKFFHGKLRI
ncbi:hypothetical protein DLM78_06015 [Leptospira stimsonii]|uniref:Uncharacterized protein n=1 Tax=Leptospira stimsonii TaxID=2202203 RepID=A0A8B3D0D4_9LEPT|nr:hypothetical protein DLM78_06015 [Leptospira stimsonii]